MTINKYDKFALLPKKCAKCRKTFMLEPYNIYIKQVGIECHDLEQIYCRDCSETREKANRLAEWMKSTTECKFGECTHYLKCTNRSGKCERFEQCKTYMDKYDNDKELWEELHG